MISRVQKEINWSSPDAEQKATELARTALLQYVERYLAGGNEQLSEYSDKKQPLRVAEQFDAILKASPYIFDYDREFYGYLSDNPKKHLDGVEDFLYWSKEKFGLKPVISVTHVSIYRKPEPPLRIQIQASISCTSIARVRMLCMEDSAGWPAVR